MSESQRSQRLKVPTEKGRLLKLGNLQQKRNKLSTLIYKELKEVDELIQCNNLPEASERASQIQKLLLYSPQILWDAIFQHLLTAIQLIMFVYNV